MNGYSYAPQVLVENINISIWGTKPIDIKKENENKIFSYHNNMETNEENYNFHATSKNQEIFNMSLSRNIKKLEKIAKLEDNWNDNGAKRFPKEHLDTVTEILKKLPVQPSVFPTALESVQLEYEEKDKYLEFNIYENNQLDIYYESSKDSYEKSVPLDSKIMIQEINKFYNEL